MPARTPLAAKLDLVAFVETFTLRVTTVLLARLRWDYGFTYGTMLDWNWTGLYGVHGTVGYRKLPSEPNLRIE